MRAKRTKRSGEDFPVFLDGATAFAEDAKDMGPLDLVRLFKSQPQFAAPLAEALDRDPELAEGAGPFGRPRTPGRWELAYLAFVASGHIDVQPWWKNTADDLWRECGFVERPPYYTVWEWFAKRLEARAETFTVAVSALVAHARKQTGGLVGRDLHVDSTEAETHARLRHVCPKGRSCWKGTKSAYTGRRQAAKSAEANLDEVKRERQRAAEAAEDEAAEILLGADGKKLWTDADGRRLCTVGNQDCIYEILDPTAGVRAYTGPRGAKRFWLGFYNQKAIDHYTGAPVAIHLSSASVPEWKSYPQLFNRAIETVGEAPRAVVADKGFSLGCVFEMHTKVGTASVIPWRKRGARTERAEEDNDQYDRHGVPRCKHCGAETRLVRFNKANPKPRLWVTCTLGTTADCKKTQSLYCERDWRLLLPMWRTSETYQALRAAHSRYERVHHHWRTRYRVGSDDHKLRPKRRGIACQQLRANAALVIEWLLILWREGWLGSARRNPKQPTIADAFDAARSFRANRRRLGLHMPYGTAARKLDEKAPLRPKGRAPTPVLAS